jgi:hypothetical protein
MEYSSRCCFNHSIFLMQIFPQFLNAPHMSSCAWLFARQSNVNAISWIYLNYL